MVRPTIENTHAEGANVAEMHRTLPASVERSFHFSLNFHQVNGQVKVPSSFVNLIPGSCLYKDSTASPAWANGNHNSQVIIIIIPVSNFLQVVVVELIKKGLGYPEEMTESLLEHAVPLAVLQVAVLGCPVVISSHLPYQSYAALFSHLSHSDLLQYPNSSLHPGVKKESHQSQHCTLDFQY